MAAAMAPVGRAPRSENVDATDVDDGDGVAVDESQVEAVEYRCSPDHFKSALQCCVKNGKGRLVRL
jgi:hypothetical protein